MKLRLTVVDTPGYGDAINCRDWYAPHGAGCPGVLQAVHVFTPVVTHLPAWC